MQNADEENEQENILIIGRLFSNPHVQCYTWDELPPRLNVADFKKVILFISALAGAKKYQISNFFHYYSDHNISDLVFNPDAEIIIIGSWAPVEIDGPSGSRHSIYPPHFLPVSYSIKDIPGKNFRIEDKLYDSFFSQVKEYEFQFDEVDYRQQGYAGDYLRHVGWDPGKTKIDASDIALNIAGKAIAKNIVYILLDNDSRPETTSAKITLLPDPTESIETAIWALLSSRFGIQQRSSFPDWIINYKLPKQVEIEDDIVGLDKKIAEIYLQRDSLIKQLDLQKEFQRLLFETGTPLELITKEALRILGAKILPTKPRHEDIRVEDPQGRKFIIEVKGRKGNLQRDEIRQIQEWRTKALVDDNWVAKSVIIGNYQHHSPLNLRRIELHKNDLASLAQLDISLIYSTELFEILRLQLTTEKQQTAFWNALSAQNSKIDIVSICNGA